MVAHLGNDPAHPQPAAQSADRQASLLCASGCLMSTAWLGRVAWCPTSTRPGSRAVALLGPDADGEVLEHGRVPDCYLGLRLDSDDTEATGVQVVAPPRSALAGSPAGRDGPV